MKHRALVAILAAGLLIRLIHFGFISRTAFPEIPLVSDQSDMYAFWQWAQAIRGGDLLGRDTYHPYFGWMKKIGPPEAWYRWWGGKEIYHQAPLYPYLLAGLLLIRNSPAFVLLVQLLLGCLQPLILYSLGRRLFDRGAGLVAAAAAAWYGPLIFYQGTLLRDWLPPLLEPLILAAVLRAKERDRPGAWLAAGIVMGLATLAKETALLLIALTLAWLVLSFRRERRELLRPLVSLGAGFVVCLAPLVARNLAVGAPPLATSVQGTDSILIGLAPDASPIGFQAPSERGAAVAIARRTEGRLLATIREALLRYREDPWRLARRQLRKLRALIDWFEIQNNTSYHYGRDISPLLRWTIGYGLIFPLAVAGFVLLLAERRRQGLLYAYLLAALAVQMITVVLARFRLSLLPPLILGAAYCVTRVLSAARERKAARAVAVLAVAVGASLLQQWVSSRTPPQRYLRLAEYHLAAQVYASHQRYAAAVGEMARFRRIARGVPGREPEARLAAATEGDLRTLWVQELLQLGRRAAARRQIERAEQAYAEVPRLAYPFYNLGLIHSQLGDHRKARRFWSRFLELAPAGPKSEEVRRRLSQLPL